MPKTKLAEWVDREHLQPLGLVDASAVADRPPRVDSRIEADVWVAPKHVVTVLADEITRSLVHTAARTPEGRGLALRFPRVFGRLVVAHPAADDAGEAQRELFDLQRRRGAK